MYGIEEIFDIVNIISIWSCGDEKSKNFYR
jgi:hypothetical protein